MLRATMYKLFFFLVLMSLLGACGLSGSARPANALSAQEGWTVDALVNESQNATASGSAEALIEVMLRAQGVREIINGNRLVHVSANDPVRYALSGTVHQWDKGSSSARGPVVSLSLELFDRHTDNYLWRDTQTVSGRGADSLHKTAQRAIARLLKQLNIDTSIPVEEKAPTVADSSDINDSLLGINTAVRALQDGDSGISYVKNDTLVGNAVAIYYGANAPVSQLAQFDRLVLEPDNVSAKELEALQESGAVPYAYLSVGEVGPMRDYAQDVDPDWVLARNAAWGSMVMNMSDDRWQAFLLARVGMLHDAGYRGLFLDTMDSYQIAAKSAADRQQQQAALIRFIKTLADRYPDMRLISNRGFEVLDAIAVNLESVAAESLYASWDNVEKRYRKVPAEDQAWLKGQLNKAKEVHGLDVIVIDYLPPSRRDQAQLVAQKIANDGFTPWVSTPGFDYVGVGGLEVLPREILFIFDSRQNGPQANSELHRFVATPLEYMGYVPSYIDVATDELPAGILKGRYAGIVGWASAPYAHDNLQAWVKKQLDDDVPIAFLGSPFVRFDNDITDKLGIALTRTVDLSSVETVKRDEMLGFETDLSRRSTGLGISAISTDPDNTAHYSVRDKDGTTADVVLTGKWGGIAMDPGLADFLPDNTVYWILDPFAFLKMALHLDDMPMPDVTTQNGKRMWLAHIDGDALPSYAEMAGKRQLGADVIREQFLEKYPLPHTVSVVEGEITGIPAYQDRRQRMIKSAKEIFAMPNVNIATHSYSHPFRWRLIRGAKRSGKYNLPIRGYELDATREVAGSANYINRVLAPADKKTEIFLWTGDAYPDEEFLAAVDDAGLMNMNGGETTITRAVPTLTLVSPMARIVGEYTQVYAPIMNENVYTDEWRGPYDGFRRVIETFQMTDRPRRLKPINVYYHFYAGTKQASVQALSEVYEWSTTQDINPVKLTDYIGKVHGYRRAGLARYLDGTWKLDRLGGVQSLRILREDRWPDLSASEHIAGAKALHDGIYIHTDGADTVTFKTHSTPPREAYLAASNGRVLAWEQGPQGLRFRVTAEVPVTVEIGGAVSALCTVRAGSKTITGKPSGNQTHTFTFTTKDTGDAFLNCQA